MSPGSGSGSGSEDGLQMPVAPNQVSSAASTNGHDVSKDDETNTNVKKKNKAKANKPKTLKKVLPSGAGFHMCRGADNEDIKFLDDVDESTAFKNALRAFSPNLEKYAVDAAIAQIFAKLIETDHSRKGATFLGQHFRAAASQFSWITEAMDPNVAVKVMLRLYEARLMAIKFSEYRQHPLSYDQETLTAKAIDAFCLKKPFKRPDDLFCHFAKDQLDQMMGKILRHGRADWGKKLDELSHSETTSESHESGHQDVAADLEATFPSLSLNMKTIHQHGDGPGSWEAGWVAGEASSSMEADLDEAKALALMKANSGIGEASA